MDDGLFSHELSLENRFKFIDPKYPLVIAVETQNLFAMYKSWSWFYGDGNTVEIHSAEWVNGFQTHRSSVPYKNFLRYFKSITFFDLNDVTEAVFDGTDVSIAARFENKFHKIHLYPDFSSQKKTPPQYRLLSYLKKLTHIPRDD